MTTLTIEITEDIKEFVDRRVASGSFKDSNSVVLALFHAALLAERRNEIDQKLLEAMDEIDRGECTPWQPGDARKLLDEITRQRSPNGTT